MPSKSQSQHRFFLMLVHNPDIAKKRGVDLKIAREFLEEDRKLEEKNPGHLKSLPEKAEDDDKDKKEESNESNTPVVFQDIVEGIRNLFR